MVTISTMKWSVAVTSILMAVCCLAAEYPNAPPPYKNHRISDNNDTQKPLIKYPVYPVQVYANLSNVKNIFTGAKPTEKPKTTDVTLDAVRLFITPESGKWKQTQSAALASTTPSTETSVYGKASSSPAVYLVTAMNAAQTSAAVQDKKSPVYTPPSPNGYRDASELRNPVTVDESSKRKSHANGTNIRRVSKTQNRMQSNLLYATTTVPSSMTNTGNNNKNNNNNNNKNNNNNNMWNATTYGMIAKVQSSSNASKPYANVLVPKQMLDGRDPLHNEYLQENSFRPIAAPTFSHKQQQQQSSIDTNRIENRRVSGAAVPVNGGGRTHVATGVQKQKAKNNGFAMTVPYKVDEHIPTNEKSSSGSAFDRDYGAHNKRDRSDVHATYVLPDAASADKARRDPVKYDPTRHEILQQPQQQHRKNPDSEIKYGFTVPESVKQPFKSGGKPDAEQYREFYPATETPKKDLYTRYNSDGKFDTRPSPSSSSFEVAAGPPTFELGDKPSAGPPASWLATAKPETESGDTEYVLDDHAKNIFKSMLRDMLKSKQPADIKSKPFDADEAIDSYFKINRPNEDFGSTGYSIETDMSCNLRSTKHITDGQCVSTRPVVEAVCADRCLVYTTAPSLSPQRQRSSPLANQQVEALHCVDGDSKFVRVQLKCRDGNTVNHIIRVVTNCRCKLHQIQPQMRSNIASWNPPASQMLDANQEILMNMAASASFERQQRPQQQLRL